MRRPSAVDEGILIPARPVATLPDGSFHAAPSRAHRATDCDDDGEVEFDAPVRPARRRR